jgi:hypothetical protein
MKTFTTTGAVFNVYDIDDNVVGYKVGREGMKPIRLARCIDEYLSQGHHIHIDNHGNPWVKR